MFSNLTALSSCKSWWWSKTGKNPVSEENTSETCGLSRCIIHDWPQAHPTCLRLLVSGRSKTNRCVPSSQSKQVRAVMRRETFWNPSSIRQPVCVWSAPGSPSASEQTRLCWFDQWGLRGVYGSHKCRWNDEWRGEDAQTQQRQTLAQIPATYYYHYRYFLC